MFMSPFPDKQGELSSELRCPPPPLRSSRLLASDILDSMIMDITPPPIVDGKLSTSNQLPNTEILVLKPRPRYGTDLGALPKLSQQRSLLKEQQDQSSIAHTITESYATMESKTSKLSSDTSELDSDESPDQRNLLGLIDESTERMSYYSKAAWENQVALRDTNVSIFVCIPYCVFSTFPSC